MDIKKLLTALSEASGIGNIKEATNIAKAELSKYAEVQDFGSIGLIGKIDKGAKATLLLDAHIDEVGFVVTSVLDSGFLKVSAVGGIDPRILPSTPVMVHGKTDIPAVFASTPLHLAKEESAAVPLDEIYLDTALNNIKDIVSVGDYVTYNTKVADLAGNRISGKSFDDRALCAAVIEVASRIYDKPLPFNIIISLSEQEELGTRGAVTSAFANEADFAVVLDVSFASAPDVPSEQSGKLGGGAMIGISPILNKSITDKIKRAAEKNSLPYQNEVMGGKTGTDADVISISKSGIPTGLISLPLRNMHTPYEIISLDDLENLADILESFILGGNENA